MINSENLLILGDYSRKDSYDVGRTMKAET